MAIYIRGGVPVRVTVSSAPEGQQDLLAENGELRRQLADAEARAAALDERLTHLQTANEIAYREAYDVAGGPHLCTRLPFGQEPSCHRGST